ncbi:hypothetical protein NPIL_299041 [Nephila pilipes]|uniref:Mutator-like transposase domain-containing protein n=1 Tax=Nephila pilipes TaxID=299642 RepID=A0A8X6MNK0_NEPPI|nr:hypothetical protein NPIL_299041 [Nephila pilipes]
MYLWLLMAPGKRGLVSLNGVVTTVSVETGKIVDAEVFSRYSCNLRNGNAHREKYFANYFGNSGELEVEGALWIFNHSKSLHKLRYTQYFGLCLTSDDKWCAYNRAIIKGKQYKHKHNLPDVIINCIKQ